jgi:hypothetical protein
MRIAVAIILSLALAPACARNQEDQPGTPANGERARIRDTTLTPKDTLAPADTLPHIRDTLPDTTRG